MGHLRLGRLPKYRKWREVVALLDGAPQDTSSVALATVLAAEDHLRSLAKDPSLTYCFWLLSRMAMASRTADFSSQLSQLGIPTDPSQPALAFVGALSDHVQEHLSSLPESGPVSALSSLALRRALTETVGTQGAGLFGNSVADLQHAFREYSTQTRFGELAQRFFGDFLARTLRSYLDRELGNHLGASKGLVSVQAGNEFLNAVDVHSRQSARIIQEFAGEWCFKHNWESRGEIRQDEAQHFVAVALRKLRSELKLEAV